MTTTPSSSPSAGSPSAGRIDVHQHILPPGYREQLIRRGNFAGSGDWPVPEWSRDGALAMMDDRCIGVGILSVSAPGVHFGDDAAARELARAVNDYTAEVVKDRPDRFGQFASLPLPDVDGALTEAARAYDDLGADGVELLSNAGGRYLGDPEFEPLWAELDARAAVVHIHPTFLPAPLVPGLPPPVADFPCDTTRTGVHLTYNGALRRHPRVRVILSHGGGALPYLAHRIAATGPLARPELTRDGILEDLRRFHFDTAMAGGPTSLPALRAFAASGHLHYGSDWPFLPAEQGAYFTGLLDGFEGWADGELDAVDRDGAEALFPRLGR
ncbi:amidohydrolase family protein [Streptomyces luteireticuli]|uniref:amidohydrolase family protein n=1 Tax=Streptomyces luteireticuli TaxID=173858 RepID=UPI0035567A78